MSHALTFHPLSSLHFSKRKGLENVANYTL